MAIINRIKSLITNSNTITKKIVLVVGVIVTLGQVGLVAIFGSAYYYLGIDVMFSKTISSALSETVKVAELYLKEHKEGIKFDIISMANYIENNIEAFQNIELLEHFLNQQAYTHNLAEVMLFNERTIIAYSDLSFPLVFEQIDKEQLIKAGNGEIIVLETDSEDKVRAIVKVNMRDFKDTYMLVGRFIEPEILNYIKTSQWSVDQYKSLLKSIHSKQNDLIITFVTCSLLLCIISIFIALKMARRITRPINNLAFVTSKIKAGDFSSRAEEMTTNDEIETLSKAFNLMIEQIATQTSQLEERKGFIEMVLREISTAVVVVNAQKRITLYNDAAFKILSEGQEDILHKHYNEVIPEISELFSKVEHAQQYEILDENITVTRGGSILYLFVRVGIKYKISNRIVESYIVTLEDMTSLINAQKAIAWQDVARRIAHEIKNPLTPIHLAAEQLKRKFTPQDQERSRVFETYMNTIINHVEDIGKIVEGFVKFANVQKPALKKADLYKIIELCIESYKNVYPNVQYVFDKEYRSCYTLCDKTQISQVVINLLKNALEAIEQKTFNTEFDGCIVISCTKDQAGQCVTTTIRDNGCGLALPMNRIWEPYLTTKSKGTGLGLAIVKKIIEEHGGELSAQDHGNGFEVSFTLQLFKPKNEVEND